MSKSSSKAVKELPSAEFLQSLFSYDGHRLYWNTHVTFETQRWNTQNAGKAAGTVNRNGYVRIAYREHRWMAHRVIFKLCTGYDDVAKVIDHINGCTWDNRIVNLRMVEHKLNSGNHKSRLTRTLPLGVVKVSSSYRASIRRDGVTYYLGSFDSPDAAGEAYVAARMLFDGDDFLPVDRVMVKRPENVRFPYKCGTPSPRPKRYGEILKKYNARKDLEFSVRVLGGFGVL